MKIKLAILDKDKSYLNRIVTAFGTKYSDKFEIYSFTEQDVALMTLDQARIDVLLSSDAFDIDVASLPNRCGFAYLVESVGIDTYNEQRAICKFQKADLIYKQIVSVYAEKASSITGFKVDGNGCTVGVFCSPSGGVGASTIAAACAVNYAAKGKKVLYLNLEKFGAAELFFNGQGQYDMSDVIFALKSKKTNLPLKLESCVKQDGSGVYFFSQTKHALDMLELSSEETLRLISELKLMGEYEYIILDMDFSLDKDALKIYRQAQSIIWVGDGSAESNTKIQRAYTALATMEQSQDAPLNNRLSFLYNRVSSKGSQSLEISGLKMLGGAPRYSGADSQQLIEQLSKMVFFNGIL